MAPVTHGNKPPLFIPHTYSRGDSELGTVENRFGERLAALPMPFLQGIGDGLLAEIGQASPLVLTSCGRHWGERFYQRFSQEMERHYGRPLAQLDMATCIQDLHLAWAAHGWGLLSLDFSWAGHGYLVIHWDNSFWHEGEDLEGCLEQGLLVRFFSLFTGQTLACVQTQKGMEKRFVLGLADRLAPIQEGVSAGRPHRAILSQLESSRR
ncbi:MAG: 4-vinyl reductase [Gloeomargaritaceae cyanobacterium C42_A2020_066]|nr:4-vinyl reductase [Gloeomargaritaceae cyanobacterium C42_A2020_066]